MKPRYIPIREDELLDVICVLRMIERVPGDIPIDIYSRVRELLVALSQDHPAELLHKTSKLETER